MLTPEQLQRMIAAEFLRVGASQQSWDQNFPSSPSVWVPGPSGPALDPGYRRSMEDFSLTGGIGAVPPGTAALPPGWSPLECPSGTMKEFVLGRWQCTAVVGYDPGGRVVDPESDLYGGGGKPTTLRPSGALPRFVGGELGLVIDEDMGSSAEMDYVQTNIPELAYVAGFKRRGRR